MRSRDEVIGQVLEAARESTSKTNIMYRSFVSFDKLEELLAHLMADGLLEQEKRGDNISGYPKRFILSRYN
jgi:predicted transcriptional regulator